MASPDDKNCEALAARIMHAVGTMAYPEPTILALLKEAFDEVLSEDRYAYIGLKGTTDALLKDADRRIAERDAKLDAIAEALDMPKESWRIAGCDVMAHQVRDLLRDYIALRESTAPSAIATADGEGHPTNKFLFKRMAAFFGVTLGTDYVDEALRKIDAKARSAIALAGYVPSFGNAAQPVGWVVAVEEHGQMVVYGPQYRSKESAEQDAALPLARGQKAEVWACYLSER
jgi:hypothetical protein